MKTHEEKIKYASQLAHMVRVLDYGGFEVDNEGRGIDEVENALFDFVANECDIDWEDHDYLLKATVLERVDYAMEQLKSYA